MPAGVPPCDVPLSPECPRRMPGTLRCWRQQVVHPQDLDLPYKPSASISFFTGTTLDEAPDLSSAGSFVCGHVMQVQVQRRRIPCAVRSGCTTDLP